MEQGMSRNGILFLSATVLAVAIASYALVGRNGSTGPIFESLLMFPELADQLDDVTHIAIETSEGGFEVMRDQNGIWVLPDRSNYPASLAIVRATVRGVTTIELLEKKTARPERHEAVGLIAPSAGGDGVVLSLLGSADRVLAQLIYGMIQRGGSGSAISLFYVRRADEDQTWLAQSSLDVKDEITSWIDKNIIGIQRSDIRAADMTPKEGPAYKLSRAGRDESNFTLADLPVGRTAQSDFIVNTPAYALAALSITDVTAAEQVDFSAAFHASYETFDNIAVDLDLAIAEDGHWIRVQARFIEPQGAIEVVEETEADETGEADETEGAEDRVQAGTADEAEQAEQTDETEDAAANSARARVAEINGRVEGWAYSIPEFKYDQFTKTLEDLLKPLEDPAGDD